MLAECKFDLSPEHQRFISLGKEEASFSNGFSGFLSGAVKDQKSGRLDNFEVELEKIVYQSKALVNATTSTLSLSSVTPAERGVKYTFDCDTTLCPPTKRARLQSQSSMSTLNSESLPASASPPALEYVNSPEKNH
ncbi:hypothetical protein CVT25_000604 [Psilocybe cyanescens]|uniref:Uncharacterized protein n=1 Tax=Psilocybe cyanescens TaxID=93625 RepID=A0A409XU60_PSICY|nr:hypothetical protein CVT25_000604 [Psilocybe cyanescens]